MRARLARDSLMYRLMPAVEGPSKWRHPPKNENSKGDRSQAKGCAVDCRTEAGTRWSGHSSTSQSRETPDKRSHQFGVAMLE